MPDDAWLAAAREVVTGELPAPPAPVVEVGCGPLGGLVPVLRSAGYAATGVDPAAPPGSWYCPVEFERYDLPEPAGIIVACMSLHHVSGLGEVAGARRVDGARGVLVVTERARERSDEATARWCLDRLPPPGDDPGWLSRRYAQWRASGQPWEACGPGPRHAYRAGDPPRTSGTVRHQACHLRALLLPGPGGRQRSGRAGRDPPRADPGQPHAIRGSAPKASRSHRVTWVPVMSRRATTVPGQAIAAAQAVNTRPPCQGGDSRTPAWLASVSPSAARPAGKRPGT